MRMPSTTMCMCLHVYVPIYMAGRHCVHVYSNATELEICVCVGGSTKHEMLNGENSRSIIYLKQLSN